jgi:putative transposase
MMDVTKWASQKAVLTCGQSFRRFFKKKSKYPRYKKKGYDDSLYLAGGHFGVREKDLRVSKLKSSIRMAEPIRFPGRILSVTISKKSDQYFASFQVELSEDYVYPNRCENQASVGVDVGIKDSAVLSDGTKYANPKALRTHLRKLKRLHKLLSGKNKGSQNRNKAKQRFSKLYLRIRNIRQDAIHKMTSEIVRNFLWIGIEDLNVSEMMKNHKLAQSIQDASFFEIRRQLEYKAKLSGSEVIPIHRFYPSSKICHMCGWKNQSLKLSERTWECDSCGIKQDRDVNAAKNIEKVALGHRETLVELFEFDRKRLWSAKGCVEPGR